MGTDVSRSSIESLRARMLEDMRIRGFVEKNGSHPGGSGPGGGNPGRSGPGAAGPGVGDNNGE